MWESWIILHWGTSVTKSSVVRFTVRGKLTVLDGGICMGVSSGDTNCVGYTCRHSLISPSESKHCSLPSDSVRMSRVFNSWHDLKCKSALQNFHQVSQHSQRMCGCPDVKGGYRGAHKSEVISTTKGVCEQIFIISTEYNHFTTYLLIFNFLVISLISVVARKWIIIVWTKYLMFPLFNPAYKQMRHQQFIAHTITQSAFPTVGPELAEGLVSALTLLGGSQLKVQTTTAWHVDHHYSLLNNTHVYEHSSASVALRRPSCFASWEKDADTLSVAKYKV